MASDIRIGQGFDVHQLIEGRKLVIGGVEIPHTKGLLGHSDADLLLHAIIDALLGAAGLEDIGVMFPDDEATWKDADSGELLKMAYKRIKEEGWEIVNLDSTVVCERPKLREYIPEMRKNIAEIFGCSTGQVNVKATRMEKLGSIGREEGLMAMAVVLISKGE